MSSNSTSIASVLEDTIGGVWGDLPGVSEIDVLVYRSTEFRNDGTLFHDSAVTRSVSQKQTERRSLRPGDILLEKSGGGPKQPVGRVAWVEDVAGVAVCANFVQLVRPDAGVVVPRFLFYILWFWHQTGRTLEFQAATTGIRNLRTPDYLAQEMLFPEPEEQERVVAIVDAATNAMDCAARYTATLESLGRAQRREAMTGVSPDVPLETAVDVTMGRQRSPKHAVGEHPTPYLRAANVKDGRLWLDDILVMNFTPKEQEKYRLVAGDVLVTEGCGSLSQIGASARWADEMAEVVCFQNTVLRLRAREGTTDERFLYHWARWAFESGAFAAVANGTNIFHIGATRAAVMDFPLPSLDDQRRIADALDAAADAAKAAGSHHQRLVELRVSLLAGLLGYGTAEARSVVGVAA